MHINIQDASDKSGVQIAVIIQWIEREWIEPVDQSTLDDEDLARIRLIQNLILDFGVNDEAVPVILHLLDQLYHLHYRLSRE